jgi:glycosyltransferase involved in cell wall biosynthesis
MHIGLVDPGAQEIVRSSGGNVHGIASALKRHDCEVSFLQHLKPENTFRLRIHDKITRLLTDKKSICDGNPRYAIHFPKQITTEASRHIVDAILGVSTLGLTAKGYSVPSVLWGETRAGEVLDKRYHKRLPRRSIRDCQKLEQAALNSSALTVFPSQWAADIACASYSFDHQKIRVIPYGVNLPSILTDDDIRECLCRRDSRECELLFIGSDWKHHGAQIAIDATSILRARGINVHLTLLDCIPPSAVNLPEYVTVIGRVDRATQKGQAFLASLYLQSHLLILPGRQEGSVVILSEGSAYGVPALSAETDGNSTVVKNGVNGQLFPSEAGAIDYAECALQFLGDSQRYAASCWSSFKRFQTDLNWDVAVSRLIIEMEKILQSASEEYACVEAS